MGALMKISRKEVEHVAHLARLALRDEEIEEFTGQLDAILAYVDKLNELETRDVEPTSHVIPMGNVVREDAVCEGLPIEDVLANAPAREDRFFRVPRIL
jgi:aspartyl-tRNA(Asn)/glutamyl-tRNA(Gln) amidotransferase subunit C